MGLKNIFLHVLAGLLALWALAGCDSEPGPRGPEGPPGQSAVESCFGCHGDTPGGSTVNLAWAAAEYETSVHATGETFVRRSGECSGCHSNEGFIQRVETGAFPTTTQSHTSRIACWTCHAPHTNGNFSLRVDAPVTFIGGSGSYDYEASNLCATCHQTRRASPAVPAEGATVALTNRWGPHHGPQANMLAGVGGFPSTTHPAANSMHTTALNNGCVRCHMFTPPSGGMAGGHSWRMTWDDHGNEADYVDACKTCHAGTYTDFDLAGTPVSGAQTATAALLETVRTRLLGAALVDSTNLVVPGTFTRAQAQATWNYLMVLEDRSVGIHNTKYAQALLNSALDYVPAPTQVAKLD